MAAARKELDESVSPQLATLNGDAARLTAGLEETTAFSREGVGRLTEGLKALRADFEAASAAAAAREKEVDGGLAQCKESILLLKGHLDDQVGVCNARLQEISDELKIVPTAANLDDKVRCLLCYHSLSCSLAALFSRSLADSLRCSLSLSLTYSVALSSILSLPPSLPRSLPLSL